MLPAPLTQEQVKNRPDLRMDEALSTQDEIKCHLVVDLSRHAIESGPEYERERRRRA
jgi:hypothetical protein